VSRQAGDRDPLGGELRVTQRDRDALHGRLQVEGTHLDGEHDIVQRREPGGTRDGADRRKAR
jgi:hypothetical protein